RLGQFSLIAVPAETTTMAGHRMQKELSEILGGQVIMAPYSLSYCGYITTPEEYQAQCYEGGHTVFGRWTLPAFAQNLAKLAHAMKLAKAQRVLDRTTKPPQFTPYELSLRRFPESLGQ